MLQGYGEPEAGILCRLIFIHIHHPFGEPQGTDHLIADDKGVLIFRILHNVLPKETPVCICPFCNLVSQLPAAVPGRSANTASGQ